jgi:glycosyltransferase involved in cell wall biosynthesis
LPKFFSQIFHDRKDLACAYDLNTFTGRMCAVDWWQTHGSSQYRHLNWHPDSHFFTNCVKTQIIQVDAIADGHPAEPVVFAEIPAFLGEIFSSRGDLSTHFNLRTLSGIKAAVQWWQTYGKAEYPALGTLSVIESSPSPVVPPASGRTEAQSHHTIWTVEVDGDAGRLPSGVNVIGYPQGILGLGEDARMAMACLAVAQIPTIAINATVPGPKRALSVSSLAFSPKYSTSLFCLPPFEMMRLAMEGGKWLINFEAYKIGAWPWELPYWPVAFSGIYQFVDEIWAQSRFVETVFQDNCRAKVRHMPMAVEVPAPTENVRTRFRLPEKDFLFYSLFDGASWLNRKNPLGSVLAFRKAFGEGRAAQSGVGLVIKAMNVNTADTQWLEICRIAESDLRIKIINIQLDKVEAINLMNSCDSYISLHRSEGFGRVLAESMLLKKPVVATNFSGNVDFCNPETAYLVDGPLVPLAKGDYLMFEGQYWCNPDIDSASSQLQAVVNDSARRLRIAEAGQQFILNNYSKERTSSRYAARFAEIQAEGVR